MSRIAFASQILKNLEVSSLLDVGCREGDLADSLSPGIAYSGADLFPDERGRVKYLGDITDLNISETFDIVVALDILEHLDRPSTVFDRLVGLTDKYLLVSFPNCYDLKSRVRFAAGGPLGGKYLFGEVEILDRHRWLMTRNEIVAFYEAKARKHALDFRIIDFKYGASGLATTSSVVGRALAKLLPASLSSATVCGLFAKAGAELPSR